MNLGSGKFIHAVFASSKKKLILAIWQDNETKQQHEVAIETDLESKMYLKLLETFTTDEISTMTDQKRKHASKTWELIVKDIAEKYGLIYDPSAANPQDKLIIDHLFNPPEGEAGMELLFNTKLKIFDLPQVTQSTNSELKKKLREAKTPLESLYIAGKFLYE
jgi:hypothetical protein